jgi:hypothetical protein
LQNIIIILSRFCDLEIGEELKEDLEEDLEEDRLTAEELAASGQTVCKMCPKNSPLSGG